MTNQEAINLMKIYKVSQTEIAKRLGISRVTVHNTLKRMENGYLESSRGADQRLKETLSEILKEKGVIIHVR